MKRLLFCIAVFLIFSMQSVFSCNIEKIDSLFAYHIKSLNDTLKKYGAADHAKITIGGNDRMFIEMVDFFADFKFDQQGYTHQPMISRNEVKAISRWYKKNRKNLNIEKIEQYILLNKEISDTQKSIDPKDFLNDNNALDKLSNKMDSLKKVNTFIK